MFTLNIYSDVYYTWFKFIKDEFNISLSIEEDFEKCFSLQRNSGIYSCIFSEQLAIICKYPKKIHQEKEGEFRLNNYEGNAVEWGSLTGIPYDCYYIQGLNIPKPLFEKLKKDEYSLQDFISEKNEEIKSACVAYLQNTKGDNYLINFFKDNLKEINTFVDKKDEKYLEGTTNGMNVGVYTLFKGEVNNTDIAYVRCYCPSTDRMFFLGVSSEHNNAKDAIASLYRIPKKLKPYIKEINRQGERYSTSLTKEGKDLVKSLPKKDIEDLISINGDEYFSKIKYEY